MRKADYITLKRNKVELYIQAHSKSVHASRQHLLCVHNPNTASILCESSCVPLLPSTFSKKDKNEITKPYPTLA